MEPLDRDLLQRNLKLAEENNRLLHTMRRSQVWHSVARVLWWLLIFGASAGVYYYYLGPYLQQLLHLYAQAQQGGQQAQNAMQQLQQMLANFTNFFSQSTSTPK